jgi:hypothetical protein
MRLVVLRRRDAVVGRDRRTHRGAHGLCRANRGTAGDDRGFGHGIVVAAHGDDEHLAATGSLPGAAGRELVTGMQRLRRRDRVGQVAPFVHGSQRVRAGFGHVQIDFADAVEAGGGVDEPCPSRVGAAVLIWCGAGVSACSARQDGCGDNGADGERRSPHIHSRL